MSLSGSIKYQGQVKVNINNMFKVKVIKKVQVKVKDDTFYMSRGGVSSYVSQY